MAQTTTREKISFLIAILPVFLAPLGGEKAATACPYAGIMVSLSLISREPQGLRQRAHEKANAPKD